MTEKTLLVLCATLAGMAFLGQAVSLSLRAARARSWPTAAATLTHVSVDYAPGYNADGGTMRPAYVPRVEYSYAVRGRSYSGNRIFVGKALLPMSHAGVLELVRPYRVGMKASVRYDPADPSYAALETRAQASAIALYAACAIVALTAAAYGGFFY